MSTATSQSSEKKVGRWVEPGGTTIPFSDIGSNLALKRAARQLIQFIKDPQSLAVLGGAIPKATLLFGPPGTGKTLVARLIASQAGVPFCALKASELDEQYVGVGAARVRALFEEAKAKGKCIIFIDEIDAMGRSRDGSDSGGQGQTLVELLAEIDGFFANEIYIIAATNKKDVLDDALLSRFEMQIEVGLPDRQGRQEIIAIHSRNKPMASNDLPSDLPALTIGMAGREIKASCNQAAVVAHARIEAAVQSLVKNGVSLEQARLQIPLEIISADFYEGVKVVRFGPRIDGYKRNQMQDLTTLVHESGHLIVTLETGKQGLHSKQVYELSIERRTNALGWCFIFSEEDQLSQTEENLQADLAALLGGAAFQQVFLGPKSKDTGLSSDLEKASAIARQMVTRWFMSSATTIGPVCIRGNEISDATKAAIDGEVKRLLGEAWKKAVEIGEKYKYSLFELFEEVLAHGTVHRTRLNELFERAFEDANAKLMAKRSRESWDRDFVTAMEELKKREPVPFSNWQPLIEELEVAEMGVVVDNTAAKVEACLSDYRERMLGEKMRYQLRFDFQHQSTMLQSAKPIVEELEISYGMHVDGSFFAQEEPWHLILDLRASEGAVRQYLSRSCHQVRRQTEFTEFPGRVEPESGSQVIEFLLHQRRLAHRQKAYFGRSHTLIFKFNSEEAAKTAISDVFEKAEIQYGMTVCNLHAYGPGELAVEVSCDEAALDAFLNESDFDVKLAA